MAIYHLHCQIIGKSAGRSAIAAAAYRSGDRLLDYKSGKINDYSRNRGIVYSEIFLCKNAPKEYEDRETLWNAVQDVEKVKNAQLAREIEVALPVELTYDEHVKIIEDYCNALTLEGMIADVSIHDKDDGNPHAHILTTLRRIDCNGKWERIKEKKVYALDENGNRIPIINPETNQQQIGPSGRKMWKRIRVQASQWNSKEALLKWRKNWEEVCNKYIEEHNRNVLDQYIDVVAELRPEPVNLIDYRSYAERGIIKLPTTHEGYVARKMECTGIVSDRCNENRLRKKLNNLVERVNLTIKKALQLFEKYLKQYEEEVKRHEEAVRKYRCYENRRTTENCRTTGVFDKDDVPVYPEVERRERDFTWQTDRIRVSLCNYVKRLGEREKLYRESLESMEQLQISKKRNEFELEL